MDEVFYPGLDTHKNHDIARKQQNGIYGGVVSFSLKDDPQEAAEQLVKSTYYFQLAESLGGVKSLVCHPAQMTHASVPREKRLKSGIKDSLIRLSCGIEDAEDLIKDLNQSLNKIKTIKPLLTCDN